MEDLAVARLCLFLLESDALVGLRESFAAGDPPKLYADLPVAELDAEIELRANEVQRQRNSLGFRRPGTGQWP